MKIEIIEFMSQSEEDRTLDIFQLKIIDLWEGLLNEINIMDYLISLANEKGYCLWTEKKDNKFYFIGCRKEYLGFNGNQNIHEQFEWNLILVVKRILTDFHQKNGYPKNRMEWGAIRNEEDKEFIYTDLTKKQRGILTKILKINNKRLRHLQVR